MSAQNGLAWFCSMDCPRVAGALRGVSMRGYGLEQRDPRTIAAWEWAVILVTATGIVAAMTYTVVDAGAVAHRVDMVAQNAAHATR